MIDAILPYLFLCLSTTMIGFGVGKILGKFNFMYLMKHDVDRSSKKHGGELVAEVLHTHGVKYIFTLVGGHISPILVAAEKLGIRVIDTRHEVTAVFAADAVARLSGSIGVASVTAGPGVTNTITAMKNSQLAESPVLLLGGAAATLVKGRGALQDIDQLSLFKPICKFVASVTSVRNIIPTIQKAIYIAQSGTPGPVFVELPIDVLYPYELVQKELGSAGSGKSWTGKIVNMFTSYYMKNLFAGAWEPTDSSPITPLVPVVDFNQVKQCASIIRCSKKPVMLIGSQATLPPTPIDEVRKAVERIGVPCFLGGMARGLLGCDSNIQMRQKRKDALKEADVIILAGSICDFRLSYGRVLNKKAKIIAVNRDKVQLFKNSDMFWSPTIGALGSVGTFLKDLSSLLGEYQTPEEWVQLLTLRDKEKEAENREMSLCSPDKHLNPMKVFYELDNFLLNNAILVADGGDFVATAAYTLRPRGPLQWLDPGAFGTLGVGAGFALGAKLCRPDSEVWVIFGDGSFGYSLIEFDTFVRHKVPIIALIGNDAGWTQIAREQVPIFGSNVACSLIHTDYHKAVEGLGGQGILLKEGDNTLEAFQNARKITDKAPVAINVLIGKTSFRDGSISV